MDQVAQMLVDSLCEPELPASALSGATFAPPYFPPFGRMRVQRPALCAETPENSAVRFDGLRVPVARTSIEAENSREVANRGGLWFYLATGCSEVTWDIGKTLVALNSVDAALRLQKMLLRRLQSQSDPAAIETQAVQRVVGWLHNRPSGVPPPTSPFFKWLQRAPVKDVSKLVVRAAQMRPCERPPGEGSRPLTEDSASRLSGHGIVHEYNAETMRQLGLDTLILLQQPNYLSRSVDARNAASDLTLQRGGSNETRVMWGAELLDVRSDVARALGNATRERRVARQYMRRSTSGFGAPCRVTASAPFRCVGPCAAGTVASPCD